MKVLILGWEFPPLFSGGLGVATYGMVKALSPLAYIRLIIPTSGPVSDLGQTQIIGLNQIIASQVNQERIHFSSQLSNTEIHTLPIAISPYHHINEILAKRSVHEIDSEALKKGNVTLKQIQGIFSGNEVYGPDILEKVGLYTALTEMLAADAGFDVVHAHDWVTYPAAVNIKRKSGKPMIVHVHALETDRVGKEARNAIYHIEKYGLENADRVIAVSQYTKDQILLHYGIAPDKITVIHNGIEPAEPIRHKHTLRDKLVVFLGRITHQKGPHFLLETAEKVTRVYPRVKFVVAGTGDQFAHLLESSAYKKLGSKFIFAGFITKEKVNQLLAMADVYFMPSVSEPFGLTVLEAAQQKVPTVISAQSGAAEVVKSSLKADYWDTDKYANYIHALINYHALGQELTEKATHELETLTWDHNARKIMSVYEQLIVNR